MIVEDDLFVSQDIAFSLKQEGYLVTGTVTNAIDAMHSIRNQEPDIILMDIKLEGPIDGIELAAKVHKSFSIPMIYLTDQKDSRTIERAENIHHSLYLNKPFSTPTLLSQIKFILSKLETPVRKKDFIFLKKGNNASQKSKVLFNDIVFLQAGRAYCDVHILEGNALVKIEVSEPMLDFLNKLHSANFIRVHRSYSININFIESYDSKDIVMHSGKSVPIGEAYKQNFLESIGQA